MNSKAPDTEHEFVYSMGIESFRKKAITEIMNQYNFLCYVENGNDGKRYTEDLRHAWSHTGDISAKDFVIHLNDVLNKPKLNTLNVLGLIPQEKLFDLYTAFRETNIVKSAYNDILQKRLTETSELYSADSSAVCVSVFEVNRNMYLLCTKSIEYDRLWYIAEFYGIDLDLFESGLAPFPASKTEAKKILGLMDKTDGSIAHGAPVTGKPAAFEGPGSDSPEGAAKVYLEGLRSANLKQMVSAFAIESYVRNYDLEANLNRFGAYFFSTYDIKFPNANDIVTTMNISNRRAIVTDRLISQCSLLYAFESGLFSSAIESQDQSNEIEAGVGEQFTRLIEILNPTKLSTMKILGYIPLEKLNELSLVFQSSSYTENYLESNQDFFTKYAKIYGADNMIGCIAAFEIDGNLTLLFYDAIEYSGKWYIYDLSGSLGSYMLLPSSTYGLAPLSIFEDDADAYKDKILELVSPIEY